MITPVYSPTATERVLPRLALDFTTGVLDSRVTVTRALNTATRVNSSGLIEGVNANLPRFDYNPSTLAPRGLLIEESRENKLLQSEAFNSASWNRKEVTVTGNSVVAPDGQTTADTIASNTANDYHAVWQSISITAGATHTFSAFLKQGTWQYAQLNFGGGSADTKWIQCVIDLNAGAVLSSSAGATGTLVSTSITPFGNGWYRVTLTGSFTVDTTGYCYITVVSSGTPTIGLYGLERTPGSASNNIYAWGAQLEAGAFATSYIPTTTTSLTRNADVVSMTGANFSDWYNTTAGTFVTEASTFGPAVNRAVLGNPSYGFTNYIRSTNAGAIFDGSNVAASPNTITAGATFRLATAYNASGLAACLNAGTVGTNATNGNLALYTSINIGSNGSASFLNGYARKISYYPQRLLNAEMQAFSK